MLKYTLRRLAYMCVTLLAVSIVTFVVIQLPPGDYLTQKIVMLQATGQAGDVEKIEAMRESYGLDRPLYEQYVRWMGLKWFLPMLSRNERDKAWQSYQQAQQLHAQAVQKWQALSTAKREKTPQPEAPQPPGWGFFRGENRGLLQGYLGRSFEQEKPVSELLAERLPLTMLIFLGSVTVVYSLAIPIGIYSATHKYRLSDYAAMAGSFIGMSVPGFLLALILMFAMFHWYGLSPGGVFSPQYVGAAWSWGKVADLAAHLAGPLIVVAINGTAGLIRVVRGNLLDQLQQLYVTTARAKGVAEWKLLLKYPVRVAIIPVVSSIGFLLPGLIGGQAIIEIVLGLPTFGPLLLAALKSQDMFLAGSVVMIQTLLVVVGVFLSDLLLMVVDPRIRLTGGSK
ncbi:MAG: ABC transporter permease [Planctomycetaceae bacterium]|nr:ABC transporter permease [Planctomycetaceae bacterium]